MRQVGHAFPFEDKPKHQCGTERRIGIDLAFHRREPKCIGPRIGQSSYQTATENCNHLPERHRLLCLSITQNDLLRQTGDRPEQQQYGGSA